MLLEKSVNHSCPESRIQKLNERIYDSDRLLLDLLSELIDYHINCNQIQEKIYKRNKKPLSIFCYLSSLAAPKRKLKPHCSRIPPSIDRLF